MSNVINAEAMFMGWDLASGPDVNFREVIRTYKHSTGKTERVAMHIRNDWVHVYVRRNGTYTNWEVTSGRRWQTTTEAKQFLQEKGWLPV
ncbi:hypothetical protein EKK58_09145 [Candidatus Dependentiae bacterium]|nr:MAG: hypothetical protein EKK58_09145 [Candidatus Dependentiae bacterium]